MISSQRKKELLSAKLRLEEIERQNEASTRLLEIKKKLKEVQIREETRKKPLTELKEDLFA